ncbi:dihydropteroate synthase [Magnetovibrio blakemorei]|uniref:Dihydropteroate synthase n=1 Tax=Magnetovibrio blakemorei TaxID=28181 RepID=A0A1E5QA47_9PROT|nr:dihydropteroate synthase [Magnetovibrio blakemorei]OEJ68660.1 dihydropteroate synthase [Magnetovibrio blakemorei]
MTKVFAGFALDRPLIMGIVNATPDSFSDGGDAFSLDDAVERGLNLMRDGADIIDVGGESTRPGAEPVSLDEEIRRTVPVISRLCEAGACVSIDTRHALVMEAALAAGAEIINDVTALTGDARSLDVAARSTAAIILMHMQGTPGTMQTAPEYDDAPREVLAYLTERVQVCEAAGIERSRLALDPGIGFGKTTAHNLQILKNLDAYRHLDMAMVLGVSRKRFIGEISGEAVAKKRLAGSIATALWGIEQGVNIMRVHDVAETKQALDVYTAIARVH